jgi:hypothetical protein
MTMATSSELGQIARARQVHPATTALDVKPEIVISGSEQAHAGVTAAIMPPARAHGKVHPETRAPGALVERRAFGFRPSAMPCAPLPFAVPRPVERPKNFGGARGERDRLRHTVMRIVTARAA